MRNMTTTKPQHIILLENALQEINGQLVDSEITQLAKDMNIDRRTLKTYLAGDVKDISYGKLIISHSREYIKSRDLEIKKLTHLKNRT